MAKQTTLKQEQKSRITLRETIGDLVGMGYLYLDGDMKWLLFYALKLAELAQQLKPTPTDYSFVVLPAAKAYEGYLQKLLSDLNLASMSDLRENKAKIGVVLDGNKDALRKHITNHRLKRVPEKLLAEWDLCRNSVMHYDPDSTINNIQSARTRIAEICSAIEQSTRAFLETFPKQRVTEIEGEMQLLQQDVDAREKEVEALRKAVEGRMALVEQLRRGRSRRP